MGDLLCYGVIWQSCLVRVALLLELHRAEQQHRAHDAEDRVKVLRRHAHDVHALDRGLKLGVIIDTGHRQSSVRQEWVRLHIVQNEAFALLGRRTGQQLVKDVECTLILGLANGARLLQQIRLDVRAGDVARSVKVYPNKFTEARRVIVFHRLGVTEGFQNRIRLEKLLLQLTNDQRWRWRRYGSLRFRCRHIG
uniref:Putative secreted protein n=1 Tax=Anopheles darlingi TaxID=43151 RepID=A0A2M4DGC8_ANODA